MDIYLLHREYGEFCNLKGGSFSILYSLLIAPNTVLIVWMSHRKRKETKQQPGTAGQGNILGLCLVSLRFLCDIHSIHSLVPTKNNCARRDYYFVSRDCKKFAYEATSRSGRRKKKKKKGHLPLPQKTPSRGHDVTLKVMASMDATRMGICTC